MSPHVVTRYRPARPGFILALLVEHPSDCGDAGCPVDDLASQLSDQLPPDALGTFECTPSADGTLLEDFKVLDAPGLYEQVDVP